MTLEQIDLLIEKIDKKIFDLEIEDLRTSSNVEIAYIKLYIHIKEITQHDDSFCHISYINDNNDTAKLLIEQPYAALIKYKNENVCIDGAIITDNKNSDINKYFKLRFIKRL